MASPWSPIILKLFFLGDYFNKYSIKTGIRCSQ